MTALELNAELFRQLSIIAEDETLMRKAVEAIRRLAQQKEAQTEETEYISKEEVLAGIRQGLIDVKESRKNGTYQQTLQAVIDELSNHPAKALSERAEAIGKEISFAKTRPSSVTK